MTKIVRDPDSGEITRFEICEGCGGIGNIDLGDCEEGVIEECPECNGTGEIEFDN